MSSNSPSVRVILHGRSVNQVGSPSLLGDRGGTRVGSRSRFGGRVDGVHYRGGYRCPYNFVISDKEKEERRSKGVETYKVAGSSVREEGRFSNVV